jgi:serine/threonine protein kinase
MLPPGARLGRYKILRHLASGGMADIYLVRATGIAGFEKTLVLKRIRPDHAGEPSFITMFLDEARLAATLDHPNIAQVHDIGTEDGNYYFTMEYVHGASVHAIQKTTRTLGLDAALAIVCGAAAGLHHAHDKKNRSGVPLEIVHRDVSPSNILVTFDGAVKLVDFGIAKAIARLTETRGGTVKGKFGYMSPEQCRGEAVDRRSDVFALGVVLFELTVGRALFPGDNEFEVVNKVCNAPLPRPSQLVAEYPAELEAIVMRALERDRERRTPTARQLQLELEAFAREARLSLSPVAIADAMRALSGTDAIDHDGEASSVRAGSAATKLERPRPRRPRRWLAIAAAPVIASAAALAIVATRDAAPAPAPALPIEPVIAPVHADVVAPPMRPADPVIEPVARPVRSHGEHRDARGRERAPRDAGAIDLDDMLPPEGR